MEMAFTIRPRARPGWAANTIKGYMRLVRIKTFRFQGSPHIAVQSITAAGLYLSRETGPSPCRSPHRGKDYLQRTNGALPDF